MFDFSLQILSAKSLTVTLLVKKFLSFYRTQIFITAFARTRYWLESWTIFIWGIYYLQICTSLETSWKVHFYCLYFAKSFLISCFTSITPGGGFTLVSVASFSRGHSLKEEEQSSDGRWQLVRTARCILKVGYVPFYLKRVFENWTFFPCQHSLRLFLHISDNNASKYWKTLTLLLCLYVFPLINCCFQSTFIDTGTLGVNFSTSGSARSHVIKVSAGERKNSMPSCWPSTAKLHS
jgi:hypothetical protein